MSSGTDEVRKAERVEPKGELEQLLVRIQRVDRAIERAASDLASLKETRSYIEARIKELS